MSPRIRSAGPDDAEAMGRIHVRAWQSAYAGGLLPADALAALSAKERAERWRGILEAPAEPRAALLVAEVDGRVCGFVGTGPAEAGTSAPPRGEAQQDREGPDLATPAPDGLDHPCGEVRVLNVDPDHWRGGLGRALLVAAQQRLVVDGFRSAVLWMHRDNDRARAFYEANGWQVESGVRSRRLFDVEVPEVRCRRRLPDGRAPVVPGAAGRP